MKVLVIMVVITILFIGFAIWVQQSLESSAQTLTQNLNKLEQAVKGDDWDTANRHLESFNQLWEKTKNLWQIFIDHNEIDNIDVALARVNQLVSSKEKAESLSEISALRLFIIHIPQKESLCLVNIL